MKFISGFQFLTIFNLLSDINKITKSDNTIIIKNIEKNANKLFDSKDQLTNDNIVTVINKLKKNELSEIIISENLNNILSIDKNFDIHYSDINPVLIDKISNMAIDHNTNIKFLPEKQIFNFIQPMLSLILLLTFSNLLKSILPFNLINNFSKKNNNINKFNSI